MAITVLKSNIPTGPYTLVQVADKLRTGEVSLDDLAHVEGLNQWVPLREVLKKVESTPPAPPPVYSYAVTMQPPEHLVLAGFWIRVAAHVLDNMIVSVPFVAAWFAFVITVMGVSILAPFMALSSGEPVAMGASFFVTLVMLYLSLIFGRFIAVWLYHAILESGPHQSTWGKRACGLKVTNMTGQRITFGHATGRYFSTFITNMTMGIGYLMVAFTDRRQALHDMIAGTLVVKQ
jgi:uncharacterized RDD family membrane protein YckC